MYEIISAVEEVEFVSDRMAHIKLRALWCDIIARKVRVLTEDKSNYVQDRFYGKLERVFDKRPKCHTTIS
jgi:hypothetical protein